MMVEKSYLSHAACVLDCGGYNAAFPVLFCAAHLSYPEVERPKLPNEPKSKIATRSSSMRNTKTIWLRFQKRTQIYDSSVKKSVSICAGAISYLRFDSLAPARSALAGLWLRPDGAPALAKCFPSRNCRFRDKQTIRRWAPSLPLSRPKRPLL